MKQAAQWTANFTQERQRAGVLAAINISIARQMENADGPGKAKGSF